MTSITRWGAAALLLSACHPPIKHHVDFIEVAVNTYVESPPDIHMRKVAEHCTLVFFTEDESLSWHVNFDHIEPEHVTITTRDAQAPHELVVALRPEPNTHAIRATGTESPRPELFLYFDSNAASKQRLLEAFQTIAGACPL